MTTNIKDKITISILTLGVLAGLLAIYASFRLHPAQPALAATTYTVTKVADTNDGTCDADCSLREAITAANANAGADIIEFNITPADGTAYTITPLSELPAITEQLKIDGTTQSGSSCSARTLKVEIDGTNETYGLQTTANNFELYGVAINRVGGQHGVRVLNASNPTISCNNFGTDVTGTTAGIGNAQDGVALENVTGGTVGSTTLADRNIMAGNGQAGVELVDGTNGVNVIGNYIGTDFAGTTSIGNGFGVAVWGATGNTIGGTTSTSRNIISGNTTGVIIDDDNDLDPSTNNVVVGNYIGMQPNGTTALSNTGIGVNIQGGATGNTIGGTTGVTLGGNCTGACNVISGNGNSGIYLNGVGVTSNTVAGNFIGTDYTGATAVQNDESGIATSVGSGTGNVIGGATTAARNVVSGNYIFGISVGGNMTILGNYVGLSADGNTVIPNGTVGQRASILVQGDDNVVGGTASGSGNYVAGTPSQAGISVQGSTPFGGSSANTNTVQGNCIGTNKNCQYEAGYGNAYAGILVMADAYNTLVGGTTVGAGNTIAGNGAGIINLGIATFYPLGTSILGNSIYQNSGGPISQIGIDNLQTTNFSAFINQNVTLNDDNDIDYDATNTGPNHYLNFPVINSITSTNGTATINYDLDINDSEANATGYRVEFFANDSPDATGYGQGQTYLGSDTVSGDVTGRQATITLPAGVDGSKYITATTTMTDESTDGFGHTSEFAADVQATLLPPTPTPGPTPSPSPTPTPSGNSSSLANTGQAQYTNQRLFIALALIVAGSLGIAGLTGQRMYSKKKRKVGV